MNGPGPGVRLSRSKRDVGPLGFGFLTLPSLTMNKSEEKRTLELSARVAVDNAYEISAESNSWIKM